MGRQNPFEAIEYQFDLAEKEVIQLMRKVLKRSSFDLWRKRVNSGVSQKHLKNVILKFQGLNAIYNVK